jgi:uncharacterized pyridoxamine 5'-phosphate oxidase family protein
MSIHISQATINDTPAIMNFMDKIWKKGHILSHNKELFLYDFCQNDLLNIIIAKDEQMKVVGIFGFIKYNNLDIPDIAGSLWKVDPNTKEPFLGMKLRKYFMQNIKQDFFAAPGAGIQTKPIYKALDMNFLIMDHFYIANNNIKQFKLLKNPVVNQINTIDCDNIHIKKANSIEDIKSYKFNKNIVPLKDLHYINKRYFSHPIYIYDIYYLTSSNVIKNIFICRTASHDNQSAYRIVDFFGELDYIKYIVAYLYEYIKQQDIEYIDFVSFGYDKTKLIEAGFAKLDLEDDNIIVPNHFEPFVQKNIPIYLVSNKTDKIFRQHKADGDQERPNLS